MTDRSSAGSFAGLLAVGLGVCCGIPVLASLGVLVAIAGLSSQSWVLVAIGVTAAVIGSWRWWHRRTPRRPSPSTDSSDTRVVPDPGGDLHATRDKSSPTR